MGNGCFTQQTLLKRQTVKEVLQQHRCFSCSCQLIIALPEHVIWQVRPKQKLWKLMFLSVDLDIPYLPHPKEVASGRRNQWFTGRTIGICCISHQAGVADLQVNHSKSVED